MKNEGKRYLVLVEFLQLVRWLEDCLSVILWLDKGDFPENLHTVCPCYNK